MLLPDHSPEIPKSFRERALGGNVGVLAAIAVNVVGVDVVAARDTWVTEGTCVNHGGFKNKGLKKIRREVNQAKPNIFRLLRVMA